MKVLFDAGSEYQDGLPINLDFSPFENEKNNLLYAFGINPGYRIVRPDRNQFKYTVYFEAEETKNIDSNPEDLWQIQVYLDEEPDLDVLQKQIAELALSHLIDPPILHFA